MAWPYSPPRRHVFAHFALHIAAKSTLEALLVPLFGQFRKVNSTKLNFRFTEFSEVGADSPSNREDRRVYTPAMVRQESEECMRRVTLLVTAIGVALLFVGGVALAEPTGMLKQYKVPTAGSSPEHITQASDGNFWFTESFVNDQNALPHKIGRITPSGTS
jgi:hypothetical protein